MVMQDYTDMMSHLYKNRIIFVGSRITDDVRHPSSLSLNFQFHSSTIPFQAIPLCLDQASLTVVDAVRSAQEGKLAIDLLAEVPICMSCLHNPN